MALWKVTGQHLPKVTTPPTASQGLHGHMSPTGMCTHSQHALRFTTALHKCPLVVKCVNKLWRTHQCENPTAVTANSPQAYTANMMSFTATRVHTTGVHLHKVQTLAKVRGVVGSRGPKRVSQGEVTLCVSIWVQVTRTCSVCTKSPMHTLRMLLYP